MTATPPLPAAVLWDMDGTIVDTEPYWIAAEFAVVERHGGQWSMGHAHTIVGSDLMAAAAYIRTHSGIDLAPEAIIESLLDQVIAAVHEEIPWRPGARELLEAVGDAGIPSVLVTMAYRRLADAVVGALPAGTFAATVTGDEVTRGKPHPEPYLAAAAMVGAAPQACIAIEDSPTGVASAEAAGCVTIAVPHIAHVAQVPGRIVIDSLDGLTVEGLRAFMD